jgi:CRP-like cAMP-binding protein
VRCVMRKRNRLVDAFPSAAFKALTPHLQAISLPLGEVLHEPGAPIRHLYFPLDCLISITITMNDGSTAETGAAGNREVVGINALMGGWETTQTQYIVQVAGEALMIEADPLRAVFNEYASARAVLLRYTQAMIAYISQNAACNQLHRVEQRYARWLLEVRDRIESDELDITQEFIAEMLGIRRAGVSEAASACRDRGLVDFSRGHTTILDVPGLSRVSCECYSVLRAEYERLLGPTFHEQTSDEGVLL